MDWAAHLDTAVVAALVSGASAVLVPRIIERVPEPLPHAQAERAPEATPEHVAAEASGDASLGSAAPPRFEGGETEVEEPKVAYAAIADSPGLVWKSVLAGLLAGAVLGLGLGWSWALLVWLPLVPPGLALAAIDWRTRLLPTWLVMRTYALVVVLTLIAAAASQDWHDALRAAIGWLAAGLLYFVLWFVYPRGLGFGDVRLSGILGIALGFVGAPELVVGLYAGFLLGGVGGVVLAMLRIVHRKHLPFGPFMLVGALVGLVTGDWLGGLTSG